MSYTLEGHLAPTAAPDVASTATQLVRLSGDIATARQSLLTGLRQAAGQAIDASALADAYLIRGGGWKPIGSSPQEVAGVLVIGNMLERVEHVTGPRLVVELVGQAGELDVTAYMIDPYTLKPYTAETPEK